MAEGSDAQVRCRASEAGQQIEIGPHGTKLKIDVEVVRPEFTEILRLTSIENIDRIDDVLILRIELFQIQSRRDSQLESLFHQKRIDVELAVAAQGKRPHDNVGVIKFICGNLFEVLPYRADVAVTRV